MMISRSENVSYKWDNFKEYMTLDKNDSRQPAVDVQGSQKILVLIQYDM